MKKTQEILGLPIISISDGIEVGKVKNIIINAEKGAIDYVVVESGIQILSARVIATENVLGIGEYALTIENDEAINDLSKFPSAIGLLQKNIQVKGTKVLTKKGRLIGEIGDIFVDEDDNCKIIGLEYIADITQKRIRIIPRESVITFGSNLVVVKEDVESVMMDKASDLSLKRDTLDTEKKNLTNTNNSHNSAISSNIISETDKIIADEGDSYFKEIDSSFTDTPFETLQETGLDADFSVVDAENIDSPADHGDGTTEINSKEQDIIVDNQVYDETANKDAGLSFNQATDSNNKDASSPQKQSSASSLFEQRQKQYLNGRKATKTIVNNSGNTIISEGNTITEEIIEIAKESGKLIELVMNNKA